MARRRIPPIAIAIQTGLQVDWLRPVIVAHLAKLYRKCGTQRALAAELGVHHVTVARWMADPELREELGLDAK